MAATAPKELPVRLLLGDLYLQKGLPEQALTEFRQLVEEQPLNAVAREALGLALREAHDITERATRALQVVGLADRADHHALSRPTLQHARLPELNLPGLAASEPGKCFTRTQ